MSDNEDNFDNIDDENLGDEDGDDENLIENTYYTAKGSVDDNLDEAIENFNLVLDLEETKGKWGFKALKQLIKCNLKANKSKDVISNYKKLMTYLTGVPDVSKNDGEKAINKVMAQINNVQDQKLQDNIYTITLEVLKKQKNEKLWFNIKSKQAKLFSDARDFAKLGEILTELKQYCQLPDGSEDPKKASYLLEVYTYEITMLSDLAENKKLKSIYDKCTNIMKGGAVVLNPRVTGVIRECGGKMYMRDKNWEQANTDFWEAFTAYDEAGNPRRIQCLKYLVLANMLSASQINPFDSPQAKPYKNHNEIIAMNNLVSSFQRSDIKEFEKILKNNKATISDDSFLAEYLPDLYKSIRIKVLLKLIKPYTRIQIKFVAQELNITQEQVEGLCVDMILDQLFDGHVDQIHQVIEMGANKNAFTRYKAIADWTKKLGDVHSAVMNKVWA